MLFSRQFHAMIVTIVLVLNLAPGVLSRNPDCSLFCVALMQEIFNKLLHQLKLCKLCELYWNDRRIIFN